MLAIKFKRIGKKKQPNYRIIVTEKRSKVFGRFIEDLGWYNPRTKEFKIDKERAGYRIKTGAQPTDSIHNLFVRAEVISVPKRQVHKKSKSKNTEESKVATK